LDTSLVSLHQQDSSKDIRARKSQKEHKNS
jgi:hypothetical protein